MATLPVNVVLQRTIRFHPRLTTTWLYADLPLTPLTAKQTLAHLKRKMLLARLRLYLPYLKILLPAIHWHNSVKINNNNHNNTHYKVRIVGRLEKRKKGSQHVLMQCKCLYWIHQLLDMVETGWLVGLNVAY